MGSFLGNSPTGRGEMGVGIFKFLSKWAVSFDRVGTSWYFFFSGSLRFFEDRWLRKGTLHIGFAEAGLENPGPKFESSQQR